MTPGQQLAELSMVTAKEVREAGSVMMAMAKRAEDLALALLCSRLDAMVVLVKGQTELLGYVHQKQPAATPSDAKTLPSMWIVDAKDMAPSLAGAPAEGEGADILEGFLAGEDQVGPAKSDGTP